MDTQVQSAARRARQYWYVDGLAEITIGGMLLTFALLFLATAYLQDRSPLAGLLGLAYPLAMVLAGVIGGRWVRSMKQRLTYPRTGFVSYPRPSKKRRTASALIGAIFSAGLVAVLATTQIDITPWMALIDGLTLGIILLFLAPGLLRFSLLAGLSLAWGGGLTWAQVGGNWGHGAFFGLMGLALIVTGSLTLQAYLRQTETEAEAGGE